jgi:CTP:molybdopterin cytidylyltransferase MocA
MTVAAVILAASRESALRDVDGQVAVRRLADAAWSGGAIPIVVVTADPDGAVAAALAGASVTLAEPALSSGGPVAQMDRGLRLTRELVGETEAGLVWPARMVWVGPETVTSLIEASGLDRGSLLRPLFDGAPGWPVVFPLEHLDRLAGISPNLMPDDIIAEAIRAGVPARTLELGDPGVTHDASVARAQLPAYVGPPEPGAAHQHEWGAALADQPEDAPLQGPALAPYGPAADEDPDA